MGKDSWLPDTRWWDDLDVLGSETYEKGQGPYLDPNMEASWRAAVWRLLTTERDVAVLAFWARGIAQHDWPFASQALRDRANAYAAPVDVLMKDDEVVAFRGELQLETRPEMLVAAAKRYEAKGHVYAGNALRERAALIRVARKKAVPAPEVVWPWKRDT